MLDLDPGPYAAFIWPAYGLTILFFVGMISASLSHARRWRKKAEDLGRDREA